MSLKKEYIKMRNKKTIDFNLLSKYYISKNGDPFIFAMMQQVMIDNIDQILEHLDKEFELDVLIDKNNNFVKVYEHV